MNVSFNTFQNYNIQMMVEIFMHSQVHENDGNLKDSIMIFFS